MKNEELIKALRYHADATIRYCDECPYQSIHKINGMCLDSLISDAADAIEAAEKRIEELEARLPSAQPTIEAVEVVRGEWINKYPLSTCSVCSATMILNDYSNYCPNCGAKMKGEEE